MQQLAERTLVACAVIVTALVAWRELGGIVRTPASSRELPGVAWEELVSGSDPLEAGHSAADTLVVLTDFQCPACRRWNSAVLSPVRLDLSDKLAVLIYPWPLPIHPGAEQIAHLFRCAARLGVGAEASNVLYQGQPMIPSEAHLAISALLDSAAQLRFEGCAASSAIRAEVDKHASRAESLGATGTPMVVLNGRMFLAPPNISQLRKLMRSR